MNYWSPSAIGLGILCPARAVAKYVWGYREPFGKAAAEGTRCHGITQSYMRDGTMPEPTEKAVHAMLKVLPVQAGSVDPHNIERVLRIPQHHGFIDWRQRVIGDLKFTSNVRYQRETDPSTDPQRIIYGADEFYIDPYIEKVRTVWTVAQFDGKAQLALPHNWTRRENKRAYNSVVKPVAEMLEQASEEMTHWQDMPKNTAACDKYPPNGCIMKQHGCRRSLANRLIALKTKVK